jgi:hypothetical protein
MWKPLLDLGTSQTIYDAYLKKGLFRIKRSIFNYPTSLSIPLQSCHVRFCHVNIVVLYSQPEGRLLPIYYKNQSLFKIINDRNVRGLGSVNSEQIDSKTLLIVNAGLQLSLRMSRHMDPFAATLQ